MAKSDSFQQTPLMFISFKDNFEAVEYAAPLQGPYEVTTPIQTAILKAQSMGKGVIVQVAVCDLSMIFGEESPEGKPDGQQTEGER